MRSACFRPLRAALCALATLAALAGSAAARAQHALPEHQLKAAFVLNFARYVTWPERAFAGRDASLVICVIGRDPAEVALADLEGKQAQGRTVRVRRAVAAEDSAGCHLAYVGESEARRLAPTLRELGSRVLTVSDTDGFVDAGGAIGIVRGENRLQFEVNRGALDQGELKASAQLLRLARIVLNPGRE